jgi:membrane-bound ClpP family serine protease
MDYLTAALLLIAIGVVLLGAEILLPTGGVLVVGALLFFALGVGTILYYGDTVEAAVAIAGLAVGLPAAGFVAVTAWRRMSIGNAIDSGIASATANDLPQLAGLESLKGRVGKTVSPMRPSGTVEFDGRRIDAMTEGMMLDAGVWVRCVEARAGKVLVRRLESPTGVADIDLDSPTSSPDPLDDLDLDINRP